MKGNGVLMRRLNEEGQVLAEYALATTLCVLVLIGATGAVLDALANYYSDLTRLICLPIP